MFFINAVLNTIIELINIKKEESKYNTSVVETNSSYLNIASDSDNVNIKDKSVDKKTNDK